MKTHTASLILEAQNGKELTILNRLILNGNENDYIEFCASGGKYKILIGLKDGKTQEDLEKFLKNNGVKMS